MTPDLVGRELKVGHLVVVPTEDRHLLLGVVDHLAPTGAAFVNTVSVRRIVNCLVEPFPFPGNQLLIIDRAILRTYLEEHRLLNSLLDAYTIGLGQST